MSDSDLVRQHSWLAHGTQKQASKPITPTRADSHPVTQSDAEIQGDIRAIRVWIEAGAGLSVAVAAAVQLHPLLGNLALTLIASVVIFLLVFVALLIALGEM